MEDSYSYLQISWADKDNNIDTTTVCSNLEHIINKPERIINKPERIINKPEGKVVAVNCQNIVNIMTCMKNRIKLIDCKTINVISVLKFLDLYKNCSCFRHLNDVITIIAEDALDTIAYMSGELFDRFCKELCPFIRKEKWTVYYDKFFGREVIFDRICNPNKIDNHECNIPQLHDYIKCRLQMQSSDIQFIKKCCIMRCKTIGKILSDHCLKNSELCTNKIIIDASLYHSFYMIDLIRVIILKIAPTQIDISEICKLIFTKLDDSDVDFIFQNIKQINYESHNFKNALYRYINSGKYTESRMKILYEYKFTPTFEYIQFATSRFKHLPNLDQFDKKFGKEFLKFCTSLHFIPNYTFDVKNLDSNQIHLIRICHLRYLKYYYKGVIRHENHLYNKMKGDEIRLNQILFECYLKRNQKHKKYVFVCPNVDYISLQTIDDFIKENKVQITRTVLKYLLPINKPELHYILQKYNAIYSIDLVLKTVQDPYQNMLIKTVLHSNIPKDKLEFESSSQPFDFDMTFATLIEYKTKYKSKQHLPQLFNECFKLNPSTKMSFKCIQKYLLDIIEFNNLNKDNIVTIPNDLSIKLNMNSIYVKFDDLDKFIVRIYQLCETI